MKGEPNMLYQTDGLPHFFTVDAKEFKQHNNIGKVVAFKNPRSPIENHLFKITGLQLRDNSLTGARILCYKVSSLDGHPDYRDIFMDLDQCHFLTPSEDPRTYLLRFYHFFKDQYQLHLSYHPNNPDHEYYQGQLDRTLALVYGFYCPRIPPLQS